MPFHLQILKQTKLYLSFKPKPRPPKYVSMSLLCLMDLFALLI